MTKINLKKSGFWLGASLGALGGWPAAQQLWGLWQVGRRDVFQTLAEPANRAPQGVLFEQQQETDTFTIRHVVEDGIERISYFPKKRTFETPLLLQHGMWHGAWCWQTWQELWAGWGWESHAYSLPGHGNSPVQRPIPRCTLDYYLAFLLAEVQRLARWPVLIGHSMGGALTQWYLKYIGDLPAAVLVAPWPAHSVLRQGAALLDIARLDPIGFLLTSFKWRAMFGAHSPASAARLLLTEGAIVSPEELYARLGPESALVVYQHNAPFWFPPTQVDTPVLWLAAEKDATVPVAAQRQSAGYYSADYGLIEAAGHNLMMEHNYRQTAAIIHNWLVEQGIL